MGPLHAVRSALVPALCAACGRVCRSDAVALHPLQLAGWPRRRRCPAAVRRGSTGCWSSAPHEGVARDLVAALKFRRLLPVAETMAERIEWLAPASLLSGEIVPVPSGRLRVPRSRLRSRG